MHSDQISQYLIYGHIATGAIALMVGAIALLAKKGSWLHKRCGKVFLYSMTASALVSMVVAMLPGHESAFLLGIAVMSLYFIISGYRSLRYKHKNPNLTFDKIISIIIIVTGFVMVVLPILQSGKLNVVLFVFGILSMVFGISDFKNYKDLKALKKKYLQLHLSKITGGYISAVSAFFVVNQILPGIWNWFTPGVLGAIFIVYWSRKVERKKG